MIDLAMKRFEEHNIKVTITLANGVRVEVFQHGVRLDMRTFPTYTQATMYICQLADRLVDQQIGV